MAIDGKQLLASSVTPLQLDRSYLETILPNISKNAYIGGNGNDSNVGSISSPFQTIQGCLNAITDSYISSSVFAYGINLLTNVFAEIANPLALKPNMFFVGQNRQSTVIQINNNIELDSFSFRNALSTTGNALGLSNLTIKGSCAVLFDLNTIFGNNGDSFTVSPHLALTIVFENVDFQNTGGIVIKGSKRNDITGANTLNVLFKNCTFSNDVFIYDSSSTLFENCIFIPNYGSSFNPSLTVNNGFANTSHGASILFQNVYFNNNLSLFNSVNGFDSYYTFINSPIKGLFSIDSNVRCFLQIDGNSLGLKANNTIGINTNISRIGDGSILNYIPSLSDWGVSIPNNIDSAISILANRVKTVEGSSSNNTALVLAYLSPYISTTF